VLPLVAAALYWFAPWKLFTTTTVDDALALPAESVTATPRPAASGSVSTSPAGPVVLAEGRFVSHEHRTSGSARIVRTLDGHRQLELLALSTSDGPDLRVWLTDRPVVPGLDGAYAFDDGAHHELGKLKGNRGNQVYPLPDDLDLSNVRSVTIWCARFAVSFGAAELSKA